MWQLCLSFCFFFTVGVKFLWGGRSVKLAAFVYTYFISTHLTINTLMHPCEVSSFFSSFLLLSSYHYGYIAFPQKNHISCIGSVYTLAWVSCFLITKHLHYALRGSEAWCTTMPFPIGDALVINLQVCQLNYNALPALSLWCITSSETWTWCTTMPFLISYWFTSLAIKL